MSVQPGPTEKRYAANGVSLIYTVPFLVIEAGDLQVLLNGSFITSGFTHVGVGLPISYIEFTLPPSGDLLLQLDVPFQRLVEYQENGDFLSSTVNRDFDRIWQALKQLLRTTSRSPVLGINDIDGDGWYLAKGNGLRNLHDPVQLQDAATRGWTETYLGELIGAITGNPGLASSVGYITPRGVLGVVQDMSDINDLTKGAAYIGRATRHLDSVVSLVGLVGRYQGDCVTTDSYWPGWAAMMSGPQGGAEFVWDASRPKSQHNAGNIVSPTVPWAGTEATFAAYIAKTGESAPGTNGCWVQKNQTGNEFNVLQWGARNDATTNGANDAMTQPLLDYVETAVGGGFGGIVRYPRGNYRYLTYFNTRDRTTLRGEGTSASILQFYGTAVGNCITLGPTGPNHPINPSGHWVFGARIENLAISGGNIYRGTERAMVYTDGAHEHSGLFNVVVRDFASWGVNYNTGDGGPASFNISDVEMYAADILPAIGTKRGVVCQAGGSLVKIDRSTITGGVTYSLVQAVLMLKDNLLVDGLHIEHSTVGVSLSQNDPLTPRANFLSGVSGNSTVPTLVNVSSTFEGSVSAHALVNTSLATTGLVVLSNLRTGEVFVDQALASYAYGTNVGPGVAVANGRIAVSSTVATIAKSAGRTFTVSRTGVGVVRVTLSSAMQDTNYTVTPTARSTTGMFSEFSPVNATAFDIKTYDTTGVLTDPTSIWFSLFS